MAACALSMIIHDLDLLRPFVAPPEYDPPLIVQSDRMLACEVASQRFQAVPRRRGEIAGHRGVVQVRQFRRATLAMLVGNPLGTRRRCKISAASAPRKLLIITANVSWHDTTCNSGSLARSRCRKETSTP